MVAAEYIFMEQISVFTVENMFWNLQIHVCFEILFVLLDVSLSENFNFVLKANW